ncbi:hypothetical protein L1887_58069 [Cichorium endivia]|nr:hypothetical protein L1887_58069 [Cichorium endivia]
MKTAEKQDWILCRVVWYRTNPCGKRRRRDLVDRLHGRLASHLLGGSLDLVVSSVGLEAGVVDGKTERDELVEAVGKVVRLLEGEARGRADDAVRDDDLLDLVAEDLLDRLAQVLAVLGVLLALLLLVVRLLKLEAFLGDADELLALKLLELRHGVLVDGVDHEEHLEALLLEALQEGRVADRGERLAGEVEDLVVLAVLGHAGDVVLERGLLLARLGRVEAEELGELGAVGGVLVDAELEVLAKGLVELGKVVLVLGDLGDHVEGLLDDVLADDLEDLVLLERLARDVEGQVLRVDDALDKVEVFGDDVLAVVHDEDAADVELDVVALLLGLKEIEGGALGHKEERLELELALDGEVLDGEVVLPVVGERLVEGRVLVGGDLLGVARPEGLGLVELLLLGLELLDLLLGLVVLLGVLVVDLLDLGLLLGVVGGVVLLLLLLLLDLDLDLLGDDELDGVGDELRVLLDDLADALVLEVLLLVLLEEEAHLGTAADGGVDGVLGDGEGAACGGLPDVLLVVVVLGDDLYLFGDEVGRVEADAELADHGDVGAGAEGLHEGLGAGLGDGADVVDEVGLGHADTGVADGEAVVLLVRGDADVELLFGLEHRGSTEDEGGGATYEAEGLCVAGHGEYDVQQTRGDERVWCVQLREERREAVARACWE